VVNHSTGLKPHCKVCKALWSGVRECITAGQSVITGCTSHPLPKKGTAYCSIHEGERTPVADNVSSRTINILREHRNVSKASEQAHDDHLYIIEAILDITEDNDEKIFKVKWHNFPEEAATLEPEVHKHTKIYKRVLQG
jgi:hypothetical protein